MKIGIITSRGGHLVAIKQLKELFNLYPHFWVTFKGKDTREYLDIEHYYYTYFPESRNIFYFVGNFFHALYILIKEKPTILISTGAGMAIPFFLVGKILGIKLIFIETYDFVKYPSMTGKILYNMVDLFLVQHKVQKKWFPKAKYWGALL